MTPKQVLYTIGHSTHRLDDFLAMVASFGIKTVADIRRFPGSRKFPQFDKENLERTLLDHGIKYIHLDNLGGRRKADKNSKNTRWRNASFRAYADYMDTEAFDTGIKELTKIATESPTAIMCAEAVWWRCHRSLVADYLKVKGWCVRHILDANKVKEHPFTSPARVVGDRLIYTDDD